MRPVCATQSSLFFEGDRGCHEVWFEAAVAVALLAWAVPAQAVKVAISKSLEEFRSQAGRKASASKGQQALDDA